MIKKMMVKGMDVVMLSCDEATYLITKAEFHNIGCIKRMQLKIHLMGCELCRRFKIQSEYIDLSLQTIEDIKLTSSQPNQKLSSEKKKDLEMVIENYSR